MSHANGKPLAQFGDEALAPVSEKRDTAKKKFVFRLPDYKEPLIEDFLLKGQTYFFCGEPADLRSQFALNVAVSVASGTPLLGKHRVFRSANVAYMTDASSPQATRARGKAICQSMGIAWRGLRKLHICDCVPQMDNQSHREELEEFLIDKSIEVLIVDPVRIPFHKTWSNLHKQDMWLCDFAAMCERASVTPILSYDLPKPRGKRDFVPTHYDLWSAYFGTFASLWVLGPDLDTKGYCVTYGEYRRPLASIALTELNVPAG
jgi:hypothetical protein